MPENEIAPLNVEGPAETAANRPMLKAAARVGKLAFRHATAFVAGNAITFGAVYLGYTNDMMERTRSVHAIEALNACVDPSEQTIAKIEDQLSQPDAPELETPASDLTTLSTKEDFLHRTADEHDVTIFRWESEHADLRTDLLEPGGSKIDGFTYFERAKAFAARYGVELVLENSTYTAAGERALNEQEIDDSAFKLQMYRIIEELGVLPVELIQHIKLQQISLVKVTDASNDAAGWVSQYTNQRIIYLDPLRSYPGVLRHETGHVGHRSTCGAANMALDPTFQELNPEPIYYDPEQKDKEISVIGLRDSVNLLIDSTLMLRETAQENRPAQEQLLRGQITINAAQVTVIDGYSRTDVMEDVATLHQYILDPSSYNEIISPSRPILRDKALWLMGRYAEVAPNDINYMIAVSRHSDDPITAWPQFVM